MNLITIGYLTIAFLMGANISLFSVEYFFLAPSRKRQLKLVEQLESMNQLAFTLLELIPSEQPMARQKDGSVLSPIQINRKHN